MMAMTGKRCRTALLAGMAAISMVAFAVGSVSAADVDAGDGKDAPPVPFLGGFLEETRIVYPLKVGDWEARGERLYDAAELGASVRYQSGEHLDRWIDIYFYPVGVVPPSHLDQAAQVTLDEIGMGVGAPGGYLEADFGELHEFQVAPDGDGEPVPARSADMRLQREQGDYHSAVTLLIDRMYYVKGRYSVEAGVLDRPGVRDALEQFVTELVRDTYIGSTGSCWSPAEIHALPPDAEAPADARMSVESGDGGGAWLVGTRVLAHEPEGEAAQALALLAMAMDGRVYPGCAGSDPHNPEVTEGRREIRLEYRAPADARPGRGGRSWPSRSGGG